MPYLDHENRRFKVNHLILLIAAVILAITSLVMVNNAHAAGCPDVVYIQFGANADRACSVAYCETGGTFDNSKVGAAGEVSIWQIHPVHRNDYNLPLARVDVEYATWVAFQMSNGGRNWGAWSCA